MIKLIILDLDGVIFDSELNMKKSWNGVMKKYKIMSDFKKYKKSIGLPFDKILSNLRIIKNKELIKKYYAVKSMANINKIKLFPNVKSVLRKLNKEYITAVVTSKDLKRSNYLINKYNLKFKYISCPKKNIKGKPNPAQINLVIKKLKLKKKNAIYIGDTIFDSKAAKRAKIKFIHARYGFEKKKIKSNYSINSFKELEKIFL